MSKEPRGLGKGLSALLGEVPNADQLRKPVGYVNKEIVGTAPVGRRENTADILRIPRSQTDTFRKETSGSCKRRCPC